MDLSCRVDSKHPIVRPVNQAMREAVAFADWIEDLTAIEDDVVVLWARRRAEELDDTAFEVALEQIVVRLEAWPSGRPQPE